MKQFFFAISLLICLNFSTEAQSTFQIGTIQNQAGKTIVFRKLDPIKVKYHKKYPLIVFLHGSGERGSDNFKQLVHGAKLFEEKKNRKNYPAYVIFPQCPEDASWASRNEKMEGQGEKYVFDYSGVPTFPLQQVFDLINYYKILPNVDSNRIYIMGLSMGGMGTFEAISRHPELFAAAIPICGGGDLNYVKSFTTKVSVWIFHGAQDDVVPPKYSRDVVDQIIKEGGFPKYTEFPNANHNSWDATFKTKDLFKWLFEQKRSLKINY